MSSFSEENEAKRHARLRLDALLRSINKWLDYGDDLEHVEQRHPHLYEHIYETLQQYPDLAKEKFGGYSAEEGFVPYQFLQYEKEKQSFPFAFIVAARAPLEVVKKVFDMNPDAIQQKSGELQALPLHLACFHGCPFEVIEWLVLKYEDAISVKDKRGYWPIHNVVDILDQWRLGEACRILKLLVCRYPQSITTNNIRGSKTLLQCCITDEGFPDCVVDLMVEKLPTNFRAFRVSDAYLSGNDIIMRRMRSIIPRLHPFPRGINPMGRPLLGTCNLTLDECVVDNYVIASMFSNTVSLPISVGFSGGRVLGGDGVAPNSDWSACQVNRLDIWKCKMKESCLLWWLQSLRTMPNLKEFYMANNDNKLLNTDVTESLVNLLQVGLLDTLHVVGFAVNLEQFISFLNDSGVSTNIEYRANEGSPLKNKEISYVCALNRHGRGVIRQPNATRTILIKGLLGVQLDNRVSTEMKPLVLFGLLRGSPSLWTG